MNNNITPAHVTYEQAVWLKSIGFDLPCNKMYGIDASLEYFDNSYGAGSLYRNSFNVDFITAAPEQSVVVEWLRVNFGVNIQPFQVSIENDNYPLFYGEINNNGVIIDGCLFGSWFETPQEAYSAALSYLMSNEIIKQK